MTMSHTPDSDSHSEVKAMQDHYETQPKLEGGQGLNHQLTTASEQDPDVKPKLQPRAIIVTLICGLHWIFTLWTIVGCATFTRTIAASVGTQVPSVWISNSFQVVFIALGPIISQLSDLFGRKWILVVLTFLGAVGAIVASRANSMSQVVVGTALIGLFISTQGIVTAIPSEILPHRYRSAGAGVVFSLSALGPIVGLLAFSRPIADDPVNGWRTLFYVYAGGYVVLSLLWLVAYRPPPRETEYTDTKRPSLDWIGYALLAIGVTLFLMGLSWAGVSYSWGSAHVLSTLIIGAAVLVGFALYEWKGRSDGLLHHDLFKDRNYGLCLAAIAIEGFVFLAYNQTYPATIATAFEHDAFRSSLLNLPFYACEAFALPIGAYWATRTRDTVTPTIVGYVIFTGAVIGFVVVPFSNPNAFYGLGAMAGFGFAFPLTFLTVIAQFAAPGALIGLSTSVILATRALGGSVGAAVVNVIFDNQISDRLPAAVAKATLPLGLNPQLLGPVIGAASGDIGLIQQILMGRIPGITPQILGAASGAAEAAFFESWKRAWYAILPFTVIGCFSVALLKRNRQKMDYIVDAPLEHIHHKH